MLKVHIYSEKEVKYGTIAQSKQPNISWVQATSPTDKEFDKISAEFNISKQELDRYLRTKERPHIEKKEHYSVITVKLLSLKKSCYTTAPLAIFVFKNNILTITKNQTKVFDKLLKDKNAINNFFKQGHDTVLYALMSTVARDYSEKLSKLEDELEEIEERAISASGAKVEETFHLRKSLLYIRKGLYENKEVIKDIEEGLVTEIKHKQLFHHPFLEYLELIDLEALLHERLSSVLELSLNSVSNKLNNVMKYFTIIATLVLLPTLVTGIYGMNFRVIPLADHQYGFWLALGIMGLVVLCAVWAFKKMQWL
ncbi:MAG: CorA family divalent cation transporter [Nanoarchaeota archaeon]